MSVLVLKKLNRDDELREAMESEMSVIKKVLGTFTVSYILSIVVGLIIVLNNSDDFNTLRVKFCDDKRGVLAVGTLFYLFLQE
jgi:hypothetical protein